MFGLGLAPADIAVRARTRSGPAPAPTPTPAPTFLPALTTAGASYHLVASSERLVEGYAGPLVNAGGQDFGGVRVSTAAVQTARGGAEAICIATLYDQTGAGRNHVQADTAKRPAISDLVTAGGALPILIDGKRDDMGNSAIGMAATVALTGRAFTRVLVTERASSVSRQLWMTSGSDSHLYSYSGTAAEEYAPASNGNIQYNQLGQAFAKGLASRQVLILRERADGADLFYNGVKVSSAAVPPARTLTSIEIGAVTGLEAFNPNARLLADVTIAGALSDTDCAAVDAALRARFGIPAWSTAARVCLIGDSIAESANATLTRGIGHYVRPLLSEATDWFTIAVAGKRLDQCYRDRAAYEGQLNIASGKRFVSVIQGGVNDINNGTTGANLYANTTAPYVGYLQGLGHKVVVCTLLPHTASALTSLVTERNAYNTAVSGNAAGADAVCDLAANVTMGPYPSAPNDPALYADTLHPTSLGYSYLAPDYAAAINGCLS